jgi:DNA repair protein RecO (recombination protein O)
MVYGLGRKNAAGKYSPLALVQLTTDERSVRTSQLSYVPTATVTDPYKRTIALFLSEVLFHTLRHPMVDEPMFDFLVQAVRALDETDEPQNFHLSFLIGFAARLGFAIDEEEHPELVRLPATRAERQAQLRALCDYFSEHVETFRSPRSLDILMEVFD